MSRARPPVNNAYTPRGPFPPPSESSAILRWRSLVASELRPLGWLREQLAEDFRHGLPGHLDEINSDVTHATFASQKLDVRTDGRPSWWPGEQEGYWYEGYVHAAFLLDDPDGKRRATAYVEAVLRQQAPDGYLGLYAPKARMLPTDDTRFGDFGGELHTQARVFLVLLAFHEYTGRADVLAAVERAARLSMATYHQGIFGRTGANTPIAGGNSHGISFIDPLMQLHRITGDEAYARFLETIYASYQIDKPRDQDLSPTVLDDPGAVFVGHGVHTAESFHLLHALARLGVPGASSRARTAMTKLARHLTPGGALVSDELISGTLGSGHSLYENCAQAELLRSLIWIAQYDGSVEAADRAARLFFNAVQGGRLHPLAALQYLSRDDRLDIPSDSRKDTHTITGSVSHFQMSSIVRPTCCTASAGRHLPYFLGGTWMKQADGHALAAMIFAPTRITTTLNSVEVTIAENTAYPFSDQVEFVINPATPVAFTLCLAWPREGRLQVDEAPSGRVFRRDGFLCLERIWEPGDRVLVKIDLPVQCEATASGGARYYRRGQLVFGLPFATRTVPICENPRWTDQRASGFFEYDIRVTDRRPWASRIDPRQILVPVALEGDALHPWNRPPVGLRGSLVDAENKPVEVTLVPQGSALSRRVTFLESSQSAAEAAVEDGRPGQTIGL